MASALRGTVEKLGYINFRIHKYMQDKKTEGNCPCHVLHQIFLFKIFSILFYSQIILCFSQFYMLCQLIMYLL